MRHALFILIAPWLLAMLPGCRLPGWDGPISQSLVDCRKLSRQGVAAMERGQQPQAEALLAKAVRACPSDTEARRNYAEILWQRGAQKEAIAQMEAGAKTGNEDAAFSVRLAEMYRTAGKKDEASRYAQQALALDPKSAAAWAVRGAVLRDAGQPQEALADYLRALGHDPHDRKILLEVAELYRQLNQPDRALQTLQTLSDTYSLGEEPQNVLYLSGIAYLALNRQDDAVESLHAAVLRDTPNAEILCRLAEAELGAGHPREAAAAAEQALALQPRHPASLAVLQRIQVAQQPQAERILK